MSGSKGSEYLIEIDRLRPGVFIRLQGVPWYRHPFLTSSFRIKDFDQIETLRALNVKKVICVPDESLTTPLDVSRKSKVAPHSVLPGENPVPDGYYDEKNKRIKVLREKKASVARAVKKYSLSLSQIETLMLSISRGNDQFIEDAIQFSSDLSSYFLEDCESIMHVLNIQDDQNDSLYYHSLNVTVLSLILGRSIGLAETEMRDLAMGAMFHDIGKSKIEKKILRKKGKLTNVERSVIQKHPFYGVQILSKNENFPKEAMKIVYQHHERCDGKGYPKKMQFNELSKLTKILSVANFYDGLINKHDSSKSLTPYQALSYMYTKYSGMLDKESLSVFIRCMGIYPPGTIVLLNNDQIGMVVSVNLAKPLSPSIVLYDPQIPKKEALILDLEHESDFTITDSVSPAKLSNDVYEYLSPRSRITYFVDPDSVSEV
ncbi:HDIG domain-containing protein [Maridesulfovibrio ferrireducens]|uniref:HDIG domain-containing protein n=1 Tax=Maridesulfovibrio ferrireducens TaxID=246191 RepID=A0A1G9LR42_9BACT|nr:HD-GYP domain-containing protein [Maridesulfovibrio ferrireducens]SDL64408.1 HDIG domain-containing protein [Maridesulfovibrio ferrireducens]